MWVFMLSFAGLPPTGGFLGKFYVFSAAYDTGWLWLVIVGLVATAVSLYYYLAVIRALYLRPATELQFAAGGSPPRDALLQVGVIACDGDHDRLVLRRPAADRPGDEGGREPIARARRLRSAQASAAPDRSA